MNNNDTYDNAYTLFCNYGLLFTIDQTAIVKTAILTFHYISSSGRKLSTQQWTTVFMQRVLNAPNNVSIQAGFTSHSSALVIYAVICEHLRDTVTYFSGSW